MDFLKSLFGGKAKQPVQKEDNIFDTHDMISINVEDIDETKLNEIALKFGVKEGPRLGTIGGLGLKRLDEFKGITKPLSEYRKYGKGGTCRTFFVPKAEVDIFRAAINPLKNGGQLRMDLE